MHFVIDSATPTRLSERMAATASSITSLSRRLTADHGLNGFTIEELCDQVGISRRTFFNYFPSKEDAVLGIDESDETRRFAESFLAAGSRGWPAVVDDLIGLAVEHITSSGFGLAEHADFVKAIAREPRLLSRFIGLSREREQMLAELVALREGVDPTDLRAHAAVQLVATVLRVSGDRVLADDAPQDFASTLTDTLAALRTVLDPTPERDTL